MTKTLVLLIDDERHLLEAYGDLLQQYGYETLRAASGERGITLARQHRPDVVVCDIMMPGIDGFQVLTELQNYPETNNIPFIFLTAHSNDLEFNQRAQRLGADHFIGKPASAPELDRVIKMRIQQRQHAARDAEERLKLVQYNIVNALPLEFERSIEGILGCAEYLLQMGFDTQPQLTTERVHNTAQILYRAADRLKHLTENYLIYARTNIVLADPDQLQEHRQQKTDTPGSLTYSTAQARARVHNRLNDIRFNLDNDVVWISETSLEVIVRELVDNALKYSPPGSLITVHTETSPEEYRLIIRDQGVGMDPQAVSQIDAFTRFEENLYGGIGLGLSIVRNLIEIHNGGIRIETAPDQGTECHVILRRVI